MSTDMETRIKLHPGETLKLVSSDSKGSLAETDIVTYSVLSTTGDVVGSVVHTDHTSRKAPFRRSQSVVQRDAQGAKVVDEAW